MKNNDELKRNNTELADAELAGVNGGRGPYGRIGPNDAFDSLGGIIDPLGGLGTKSGAENPCPRGYDRASGDCIDSFGRLDCDCPYAKRVGYGEYSCEKGLGDFVALRTR